MRVADDYLTVFTSTSMTSTASNDGSSSAMYKCKLPLSLFLFHTLTFGPYRIAVSPLLEVSSKGLLIHLVLDRSRVPSVPVCSWVQEELFLQQDLSEPYSPTLLSELWPIRESNFLVMLHATKILRRSLCAVGEMSTWAPISGTFPHFGQ